MINEYGFGKMVIDGEKYTEDLIITGDEVFPGWWRKKGHHMVIDDIRETLESYKPDVLIIGKGKFGMMKVDQDVEAYAAEHEIELYTRESGKAVRYFNELLAKDNNKKIMGAFHLTC